MTTNRDEVKLPSPSYIDKVLHYPAKREGKMEWANRLHMGMVTVCRSISLSGFGQSILG